MKRCSCYVDTIWRYLIGRYELVPVGLRCHHIMYMKLRQLRYNDYKNNKTSTKIYVVTRIDIFSKDILVRDLKRGSINLLEYHYNM